MDAPASGIDPRSGRAIPADHVVNQLAVPYTAQDHATWQHLFQRQLALLRGRVVDDFLAGLEALDIWAARIPVFAEMNQRLKAATGWQVVAVPGLVPDEVFFAHLAARRFPAGYWIRSPDELDYIEEPDVFHDVFGHVPLLMHPPYASYMQAYGVAGLRLAGSSELKRLARLYWYTVEFGLMRTPEGLRVFGAGIASSHDEVVHALHEPGVERRRFDLETVLRMDYEIDHLQSLYFVLHGFADLPALDAAHLEGPLHAAGQQADLRPPPLRAFNAGSIKRS